VIVANAVAYVIDCGDGVARQLAFAGLVDHPPVVPAFGFRFDTHDRSIVISGDTAPSDNLVKLAHGADVLVHSAMYPAALDRLVRRVPNATVLEI